MRPHVGLSIVALLSSMAGLASAGTISSAPVVSFWVDTQDACYVRNIGAKPVSVNVQIIRDDGAVVTPDFDSCNDGPLAPGTTCVVLADRTATGFSACSATTPGSAKNLRGTMEARFDFQIVSAQDLR
jgi:hypothetical protein